MCSFRCNACSDVTDTSDYLSDSSSDDYEPIPDDPDTIEAFPGHLEHLTENKCHGEPSPDDHDMRPALLTEKGCKLSTPKKDAANHEASAASTVRKSEKQHGEAEYDEEAVAISSSQSAAVSPPPT